MKKAVSAILVVVMTVLCLFSTVSVSAANDAVLNGDVLTEMIGFLGDNMPDTAARRTEVYNILENYMATTDANAEALITTVNSLTDDLSTITDPGLKNIAENLETKLAANGKHLVDYKAKMLLVLDMIASLPASDRAAAVAAFRSMKNEAITAPDATYIPQWLEDEKKLSEKEGFQDALQAVYDQFVPEYKQYALMENGIGGNAIAALSKAFQGNLFLTDDSVGGTDFAVKTSKASFVSALKTNLSKHFDTINGKELTGENILNAFVAAINTYSKAQKANIRTVLGDPAVNLYEPKTAPATPTPTPTPTAKPSTGGSSSSRRDNTSSSGSKKNNSFKVNLTTYATPQPPAEAAEGYLYDDTRDHWAKNYIAALTQRGILTGYGDNTFKPDMGVTREEIAVILTRALGLEAAASVAPATSFNDRSYISSWAIDAINVMVQRGIYEGYDDGNFRPQQVISREELVAVVIRIFSGDLAKNDLSYTDKDQIGEWAREYLEKAAGLSLVEGYPDGSFKPGRTITRAEASKVIYNFMHYAGLLK